MKKTTTIENNTDQKERMVSGRLHKFVMPICKLSKGDGFILRENGRLYIYHCAIVEESPDHEVQKAGIPLNPDNCKVPRFCIAYCAGHFHVFDRNKNVTKVVGA